MKTSFKYAVLVILLCLISIAALYLSGWKYRKAFFEMSENNPVGLEKVDCWFDEGHVTPKTECYYMHVPENHRTNNSAHISFPVLVLRSNAIFSSKAPVLHLGGGGPGGPMYLNYADSINTIWRYHDDLSLNIGRDLFVIDPRGTGLSKPLLTCNEYVKNTSFRLELNYSLEEEWESTTEDYKKCINAFSEHGVDFKSYNSVSISEDIELLRKHANIEQWVLFGVSYGTLYAQIIAKKFPASVESMILDSAVFPNHKLDHNYLENTLAPYEKIFDYCNAVPDCIVPIPNLEERFWVIHKQLNAEPVIINTQNPYTEKDLNVVLNGERFLQVIFNAIYWEGVFQDIPDIINELENSDTTSIKPYLQDYLNFLFDDTWGDISAETHFCYEEKPFIDLEKLEASIHELPDGYIKETALFYFHQPDNCKLMNITPADDIMVEATQTDIPTLFLNGNLDTVTPLKNVLTEKHGFTRHQLLSFDTAHSVLSFEDCAEMLAALFISNPDKQLNKESCEY